MAEKNPFKTIAAIAQTQQRIVETLGVPYADPFNEVGVIADVNDPKKEGRVKVQTDDGFVSDWIAFSGSNKGTLSARYIGAKVLIGKTNGRSENMYVVGIIKDGSGGLSGNPTQLPILDESVAVWNETTDPGMRCNEGNEGRVYILSNEMNQDMVVCLRRTNNQTGDKTAWAWKSLTNSLWVEKGFNPGNSSTPSITQSQATNPGIPECTEALLGEVHEFTEDRKFRTIQMRCKRDENGGFGWGVVGDTPVFFRTTLPNCSENLHGMNAILDDGNNSEHITCQRYQGQMLWVKNGRREPHQFFDKEPPLSRIQFTSSFKDIPALKEDSVSGYSWVSESPEIIETIFNTAISSIPLTGTDPALRSALLSASLIPPTAFNEANLLSSLARESIYKRTGIPVNTIFTSIQTDLAKDGKISYSTGRLVYGLGDAADVLINGARFGTEQDALLRIGRSTLQSAMFSLSPQSASVMTGLMSGGIVGALDTTVALGLNKIPSDVSKYMLPVMQIAQSLAVSSYPSALTGLFTPALNGGLNLAISNLINTSAGRVVFTPALLQSLAIGGFGPISQLFSTLTNLNSILKLPSQFGSIPLLMTTALGTVGLIDSLQNLFGKGGIGMDKFGSLLGVGFSAAALIVSGISALKGLFGGGLGCPCDPRCRKTSHGQDSDGNNLLEKCGALTANNANSYSPTANPLTNNIGPIAGAFGLAFTGIGQSLWPSNYRDLTTAISTIDRVRDPGEKIFAARWADQHDRDVELAYSFEAVSKAFKVTDNNITRVESVEKKLIDSTHNILSGVVYSGKEKAILPTLMEYVRVNSLALQQLYGFVEALNRVKDGPSAGVRITPELAKAFENITEITRLAELNKVKALEILNKGVLPAYSEWKTMSPGLDSKSELGIYSGPIPDPYPNERTLFDSNRVLALSLESKMNNNPQPETIQSMPTLSEKQIQKLKELPLYEAIAEREGRTDCE